MEEAFLKCQKFQFFQAPFPGYFHQMLTSTDERFILILMSHLGFLSFTASWNTAMNVITLRLQKSLVWTLPCKALRTMSTVFWNHLYIYSFFRDCDRNCLFAEKSHQKSAIWSSFLAFRWKPNIDCVPSQICFVSNSCNTLSTLEWTMHGIKAFWGHATLDDNSQTSWADGVFCSPVPSREHLPYTGATNSSFWKTWKKWTNDLLEILMRAVTDFPDISPSS